MNKYGICVILLLVFLDAHTQTITEYLHRHQNGLCSGSIFLNSNGLYLTETGCENSSYISFGNYTITNDSIRFFPVDIKTYKVIESISYQAVDSNIIKIEILDSAGNNLTRFFKIYQQGENGKRYTLKIDSSKQYIWDTKRGSNTLRISSLESLFERNFELELNKGNVIRIVLNYDLFWLKFPSKKWVSIVDDAKAYHITNDKIISSEQEINDNMNPNNQKFITYEKKME